MYLTTSFSTETGSALHTTHRIMSACRVRFPNLWEENIIVLCPLSCRKRSKSSDRRSYIESTRCCSANHHSPCSANGSRLADGSSNKRSPTADPGVSERMKDRDLVRGYITSIHSMKVKNWQCYPLQLASGKWSRRWWIHSSSMFNIRKIYVPSTKSSAF